MGCTASRSDSLLTRPIEERPSKSSSSFSHYSSSSYSDSSSTPISRTLSLPTPLVHHPPLRKGDTNHFVSLTSTTYGSLVLIDPPIPNPDPNPNPNFNAHDFPNRNSKTTLISADPEDPSSPDSVINTWVLMEGLEDFDFDIFHSPDCSIESPKKPNSNHFTNPNNGGSSVEKPNSNQFTNPNNGGTSVEKPNSNQFTNPNGSSVSKPFDTELVKSFEFVDHNNNNTDSKPLWKHLSEESLLAKMDSNVVSSYRKALSSKQFGFKDSKSKPIQPMKSTNTQIDFPGTEDRIVLYYTTLRGIRRTYEDCCAVRDIFKGFRVFVDERDISMDSTYRKELQNVLGGKEKVVNLPQVFIRGKHVGGVDEIKQLHELGDLGKLLEGFAVQDSGFVCQICGDVRFVPCCNCNGSKKIFEEEERKLSRCSECNENGLIRCPNCCS